MEKLFKSPFNRVVLAALLWIISYTICFLIIRKTQPEITLGIFLSLVPVITFGLFLFAIIKGVSTMDEVEIRIQMEAAVIAFSLSLLLIMTLGLLDLVVVLKKEDWGYRHLVPYFAIFYFTGLIFSKRKYLNNEKHD